MTAEEYHDPKCTWPRGKPCLRFSTDGTRLGADIAHTMGTTSEVLIAQGKAPNDDYPPPFASDVAAEQADWEADQVCGAIKEAEGFIRAGSCALPPHDSGWHKDGALSWAPDHGERTVQSCGLVHPPTPYCGQPGPPVDHEYPRPYPASNCDWS